MKQQDLTTRISCTNNGQSTMDFYADICGEHVWLFTTRYFDREIFRRYRSGVTLRSVIEAAGCRKRSGTPFHDERKEKLRSRILSMLRWCEQEYGTAIFRKTAKKQNRLWS